MGLLPKTLPRRVGKHPPAGRGDRERRAGAAARAARDAHVDDLPGADDGAQPGDDVRRPDRRGAARAHRADRRRATRDACSRSSARCCCPSPSAWSRSYPHQLSGGQRQRIVIAIALVLDPVLLIADEPTTALDVTTQAQILRLVLELQRRRGAGVLFITHDFGVVAEVAHRVAVLRLGRLVEIGTKDDVLRRPQHAYTQMLIGAVPTLRVDPRPSDPDAPFVLRVRALEKTYRDHRWFAKARASPCGGRRRPRDPARADARHRRRIGIGQVDRRALHRPPRRSDGGSVLLGDGAGDDIATMASGPLRKLRKRVQIVFQDPYRSLNPRRNIAEALIEGPVNYGMRAREALAQAQRAARAGADGCERAGPLSAPVLRRPAPADLHRPGADAGARAADRRRGGVRARRLGAGPGAQAARRDPRAAADRDALHHPRPARRLAGRATSWR